MIHGESGLAKAKQATEIFFGAEIQNLSDAELGQIFSDVPSSTMGFDTLANQGYPLIDALADSGLCKSKGEGRRTITEGGAYVNNLRISEVDASLNHGHLASQTMIVLRRGKKKYALLRFE